MSQPAEPAPPPALERASCVRAKVLDALSDQCHTPVLLFGAPNRDEMADAYHEAQTAMAGEARKSCPLSLHPHFMAVREWARANG